VWLTRVIVVLKSGCKKTTQRVDVKQVAGSKEARRESDPHDSKFPPTVVDVAADCSTTASSADPVTVAGLTAAAAAATVRVEKHVRDDNEVSFFLLRFIVYG